MQEKIQDMKRKKAVISLIAVFSVLMCILILSGRVKITPLFAAKYELDGIDVSHYQGNIDWDKIREQGIDFAFIKATEGSSHVDPCFAENWNKAGKTSLMTGAYHFFSFDSSGESQARHYIDTVGTLQGKLAPVIDLEYYGDKERNPPSKEDVKTNLTAMLHALEEHYHVKPIIYTTYKAYRDFIKGEFEEYPLWIRNVYYPPIYMEWTFWQYSDREVLEGYEGSEKYIDRNVFRGSPEKMDELTVPASQETGRVQSFLSLLTRREYRALPARQSPEASGRRI